MKDSSKVVVVSYPAGGIQSGNCRLGRGNKKAGLYLQTHQVALSKPSNFERIDFIEIIVIIDSDITGLISFGKA